ncbi:MAG: PD40 domain-containing protein, partial [Acidobacteria bacterium]|nr:PD40 domain-containing protein [Acidobacteriota bacterium]
QELLRVDLCGAEVATGRVVTRVASTVRDAHLSSLQYIASAGAWDPAGRRLAFASRRGGDATIEFYDIIERRRLPPLRPGGVDEILSPAWAPDGQRLAFVGMRRGHFDLFIVTVATGETSALTDGAAAELHPIWTPDGRGLVFATDAFTSDQARGVVGHYQLARLALDSRRPERLADAWEGHMLNPQWEDASGGRLLFVGDRGGVPNLWRLDLATRAVTAATDLTTGVAGITPTSPALSTAPAASRLAFTARDNGGMRVFLQAPGRLGATRALVSTTAARLPPADRRDSAFAAALADAATGLPGPDAPVTDAPYRARFGLDAVVQPSVGVGVDRFGTYAAGQIALLWSDMLGDRTLITAFQANATVDASFSYRDLGGVVAYVDRSRRWQWMTTLEQSPYRTGFVQGGVGVVDGQAAYVTQEVISRQTLQAASSVASYPFSEARRVELGGGLQRYSFTERTRTIATGSGGILLDQRTDREFPGLTLGRAMAAYVYDKSAFGATSPVVGQRYRVEVAPTVGTLRYTGLLVDYRRYLMPVPFYTLAGRVLHYGRYGAGGSDTRLSPLFLGYPELVRGYDVGSFRAEECDSAGCPVFDRLLGSRIAVANVEFRFPLLRPFGLGQGMYGPLPVEMAIFGDAGVAWDDGSRPTVLGGSRDWATSAGAAARINAFGFAVIQVSAARPFQRPGRGWVFQFSLTPGF